MNFRILFQILIAILIAAFILTLVTSQVEYYDLFKGVSTQPNIYDSIQGFPFAINRAADSSVLLTFLFWFIAIAASVFLIKKHNTGLNLFLVFSTAFLLMYIYLSSQSSCIKGYPIKFLSICGGLSPNNPVLFFAFLDFIFWLVIGLIVVASVRVIERIPKLFIFRVSYFFIPLILTIVSFVNYISCSGFFCFSPSGRGFPIYYYIESYPPTLNLKYFLIDYVFWFIVYLFLKGIWNLISYLRRLKGK